MAITQSDIDAIQQAILSGAQSVRFSDREVTYRSMKDLLMAYAMAVQAFATQNGGLLPNGQQYIRQHRLYTEKGF